MNRKIISWSSAFALLVVLSAPVAAQSLKGSPTSVDRMYRQAVNHRLDFFKSASEIRAAHQAGSLVRLDGNANYRLADVSYPYVLPAVHTFVTRLAAQYRSACGEQLVVTSGTRPTSMRLANSVAESVHPAGMAVDLRKPGNSRCLTWLRGTLLSLEASGHLEAVEERNPPHFHVAIFPASYMRYVQALTGGAEGQLVSAPRPSAATQSAHTYQVRRGDSLWTIARRNNLTVDTLKEANDLSNSRILAGQILLIPAR